MSHDQRPGRIRVVKDGRAPGRQAVADPAAAGATGAGSSAAINAKAKPAGLPIVAALLFLVACAIGGAVGAYLLTNGL